VNVEPVFATLVEDWDLFTTPVWIFLGTALLAAVFVSPYSPLSPTVRRRLLVLLPALMFCFCVLPWWLRSQSAWFLGYRYFYKGSYAHMIISFIICLAFGAGFTMNLARTKAKYCRIASCIYAPICLGLLALAFWGIRELHLENARWDR
jgi:hypothetical protein